MVAIISLYYFVCETRETGTTVTHYYRGTIKGVSIDNALNKVYERIRERIPGESVKRIYVRVKIPAIYPAPVTPTKGRILETDEKTFNSVINGVI